MNDCKTRSGRAFDRQAWTYDTARFGSHARGLYPVLLEQLVQIPHGSVLDVGCGTGELLREVGLRFPETARTGLDLSANMLAVAREKLGGAVELVQGDAERLPFADGRFEVLLCNDSFHHYPNPGAAAAEFARVLQPGGVLLLGDCTAPAGLRGVANLFLPLSGEGDVRLYSGAELAALAAESGTRAVVLAHLSRENNTPARAWETAARRLRSMGCEPNLDLSLTVAPRSGLGPTYQLESGRVLQASPSGEEAALC